MNDAPPHNITRYKGLLRTEATLNERFQAAVIANLFHPMVKYPLPSVHTFGIKRPSVFASPGASPLPGGNFMDRSTIGGSTAPAPAAAFVDVRYQITTGHVTSSFTLPVPGASTRTYWLFVDPLDTDIPVRYMEKCTNGIGPAAVGTNSGYLRWTNTPFLLARDMVTVSPYLKGRSSPPSEAEVVGDPEDVGAWPTPTAPTTAWDTNNLYYAGGSLVNIEWTNRNAFTNVAIRARGLDNTIHRMFNSVDFSWSAGMEESGMDLGFTCNFVPAVGASTVYRGSMWDTALSHGDGVPNLPETYAKAFSHAWVSGKHFYEIQVTTVENAATALNFSLTLQSWMGTTSLVRDLAGTLSNETVPFDLPNFVDRGISASSVERDREKRMTMLARDTLARTVVTATPDNPVGHALANHPQPASAVAQALHYIGPRVGPALKSAASWGLGKLLSAAFKGLETALAEAGPEVAAIAGPLALL